VGGYLAIKGQITVGALVAALAAYKDLSSPWKELLAYYNQTQDMALRWAVVTERFAPKTLADDHLFDGTPNTDVSLKGDIEINDVTIRDEDGKTVLEDINLSIPQGARIAVKTGDQTSASAFADLLTREVIPYRGTVTIGGRDLNTIHQVTIGNRIGYAHSTPHILQGTLGENILLPFKNKPIEDFDNRNDIDDFREKAEQSGNSIDPFDADWVDPTVAGLESSDEIKAWWFKLVQAMGIDDFMVRRALRSQIDVSEHQPLADAIVKLRPEIAKRIAAAGLDDVVYGFHPEKFNPVSPLGSNLLYALPTRSITQLSLSQDDNFIRIVHDQGIDEELMEMSVTLVENLTSTFGTDGTDHPLFRRLNLDEDLYHRLGTIIKRRHEVGDAGLASDDYGLMLTVPFAFSSEQMGPAFSETFKERVLQIRAESAEQMVQEMGGLFETIDPGKYIPVMTLIGNALFGRISTMAGSRESQIEDIVVDVLKEHDLRRLVAESIHDLDTSTGGSNLPAVFRERIAFSRAGIKKPDILVLANSLASHDSDERALMRERVTELMPDTTIIFIEKKIENPERYDMYVELVNGRIDGGAAHDPREDSDARRDLDRKIAALEKTEMFGELDRKQQRLLAFGARWYKAEAHQTIFAVGEAADAAFLCIKGSAGLYWAAEDSEKRMVSEVLPGRLIGDLSIFLKETRALDLITSEQSVFLRIDASDLMDVIENDAILASSLMRSVSRNLMGAVDTITNIRAYSIERGVDFSEFDD